MLAGPNYGIINHVTSDEQRKIGLHKNWIMLHKTVIPAGIINLARATADHLIIEIAAPQFYNFYGA